MRDLVYSLWRNVLIGVLAFSLGGATVAQAVVPGGIFGTVRLADRADDTHLAAVDAAGNVAVKVSNIPASEPATLYLSRTFPTSANSFVSDLYTVPAGKRLVIEYVHVHVSQPTGGEVGCHLVTPGLLLTVPLQHVSSLTSIQYPPENWGAELPARLYVEAGGVVSFSCFDNFLVSLRGVQVIASGYLVSVP